MGADRIAAIRPLVVEIEEAASGDPGVDYCARFDVPGREGAWVQVVRGAVNFAYPFPDDPIERLADLRIDTPPGLALEEWQPGVFATVLFDEHTPSREIARFVDGLLGRLLGCGEDDPLDTEIVRL